MNKLPETEVSPVIWIQGAGCTGCAISLMNSPYPKLKNLLLDELVPGKSIGLKFMATLMGGTGELALEVLERTRSKKGYILVVDGAVPVGAGGKFCTVGDEPFSDQVSRLAKDAAIVVNIGTCSSYGGIPAGRPNITDCISVGDHLNSQNIPTPTLNVPGCPPEPSWFVDSLAQVIIYGVPHGKELDDAGRLKEVYGGLVHNNCPRRGDFSTGNFARSLGDSGCLVEVGCKGPYTNSECPNRGWLEGLNWPIRNNHPCIGCTEPGFPDLMTPFYEKFGMEEAEDMYRRLK